jgi:hypothetical protein
LLGFLAYAREYLVDVKCWSLTDTSAFARLALRAPALAAAALASSAMNSRRSFDHLICGHLHDRRHREAERFRGFEIDVTTGIAGCCARTASGHVAPAPPSSVMNSRRFMWAMAFLPPRSDQQH